MTLSGGKALARKPEQEPHRIRADDKPGCVLRQERTVASTTTLAIFPPDLIDAVKWQLSSEYQVGFFRFQV